MDSRRPLNCPNCAAPIIGDRCEYCGTLFLDFSYIPLDEPFYLRVRTNRPRASLITTKVWCKYMGLGEISIDTAAEIEMVFTPIYDDPILSVEYLDQ